MSFRSRVALVAMLACMVPYSVAGQGRRVVDVVKVGDEASEREHDYAGDRAIEHVVDGRTFRQTRGWLSYSLATYEDTEVTVACTFRGTEGHPLSFDLVVEGRKVTTHSVSSPSTALVRAEFVVPFALTKGRSSISVLLRAVDGPTPLLGELRTIQEHLE